MANLYPPIIDTYMPAFVILQDKDMSDTYCDIYFSISDFNSINEIESIWISATNQYTNTSVLKSPTQLKKVNINNVAIDNSRPGSDKYKIRLYGRELKEGWRINEVYKIQLRFCSKSTVKNEMSDIIKNQDFFSEWSTVCLIQGIFKPEIDFINFDILPGVETVLTSIGNHIVGNFDFNNTDTLESYQVQLYKVEDSENILLNSGIIYTEIYNPNEINYIIKYEFEEGVKYALQFNYTTSKMYEGLQTFYFTIINNGELFDAEITAEAEDELGRIKIHTFSETEKMFGNIVIRRTSNKTNYTMWEDVHITSITNEANLDYTWYDYSIESGVWYLYCVQEVNNIGGRGVIVKAEKPVMVILEDIFLVGDGRQLKVKYDPQISSFSHVVMDSSTQTIGSKYPFIKRNANVNYRQFGISGLISHWCDIEEELKINKQSIESIEKRVFTSQEELFGEHLDAYKEYNSLNGISIYNDFTFEREFRNLVVDFLYDGKVKLFKSPSEGNILVRLMNISLTPNQTVGRLVYSFNATAYEIGECSIENFDKYGIQTVGEYVDRAIVRNLWQGGVFSTVVENETNLINKIQEKVSASDTSDIVNQIEYITDLSLTFDEQDAYGIDLVTMEPSTNSKKTVMGFLIGINGTKYFINQKGEYQVNNVKISELIFYLPENLAITIDIKKNNYMVSKSENIKRVTSKESYYSKIGQYVDTVSYGEDILAKIKSKYERVYGIRYEKITNIVNILINAKKGAQFSINNQLYTIGDTLILDFQNNNYSITEFSYQGAETIPIVVDYRYDLEKGILGYDS